MSSSGMGGKETSGSAYSPPARPSPPPSAHSTPPSLGRLNGPGWLERAAEWSSRSPAVDWLYLVGVAAVLLLAGYILAVG